MYLLLFNILILMCMCSTEFCVYKNANNEYAYCAEDATNQTLDFIPRVTINITTINMYGQPLRQLKHNAFRNVTSARHLLNIELLFCQISYVNEDAFLNLDNLTDLTLSFNQIREVDSKTFQHVKRVKNIYMASNNIEILEQGLFANLLRLEGVHLGYNNIRFIEPGTFARTPSLQYIVLSNNQLQHLDLSFFDRPSTLTSLYLHENPWICDSKLAELFSYYARLPGHVALTYMPECRYEQESDQHYWNEIFNYSYLEILEATYEVRELKEGSNVTLVCKVYGFPKPDVKWKNDSNIMYSSATYAGNNTYYFNYTFTVEQNARYDCIVSNTNVTKSAPVNIYLTHKNFKVIYLSALVIIIFVCFICLICILIMFWQCRIGDHALRRNNRAAATTENPTDMEMGEIPLCGNN